MTDPDRADVRYTLGIAPGSLPAVGHAPQLVRNPLGSFRNRANSVLRGPRHLPVAIDGLTAP
ncbi:hypothetical protein ACFV2N_37790 [Streptomyces sp. NPDC059680]|uniref:hypothetical protein n=1 Tax=Streptomyces sp. NPDC059680 TaxID=3346904 RepID=UPI00367BAD1A